MHRTVLVIAALLVLTPIAGAVGAAGSAPAATAAADVSQSATYDDVLDTSNESIDVWERAPFPLRANASEAATTVQNQRLMVQHWDGGSVDARYNQVGVFNAGQEVTLDFEDTDDHDISRFDGANATVIVGKLDASSDDAPSDTPTSLASFADMFSDEDLSDLNDNVSFEHHSSQQIDGEDGFSTTFTPSEPGEYVVMAAVSEDKTADAPTLLSGDDLAPDENVVIVGTDAVIAQDEASSVEVSDAEPGDTVTFDANANVGTDDDVHHAVALFHKNTWANAETTFELTDDPEGNLSDVNVSVDPSITEINGVLSIEEGTPMTDGLTSAIEIFTASETTEGTTLDASALAQGNTSVEADLAVETHGNWTEGTYQWVHVAGSNSGELATSAGEITIEEDGGGGGIPAPPAPGEPDISLVDTSLSSTKVSPGESFEVSATFENAGDDSGLKVVELTRDGQTVDSTTINLGAGAEETVTFTQSIDESGSYEYAVDGTTVGTVDVSSKEAAFETSNADVSDTDVSVGDSVDVTATVENTGTATGTHTAELVVDGETVDTTEVTLGPGASDTVEFTHTFEESGEYEVGVDDATAGTVSVGDDGGDGIPGFGPVAALLGLAATLLIARTRAN